MDLWSSPKKRKTNTQKKKTGRKKASEQLTKFIVDMQSVHNKCNNFVGVWIHNITSVLSNSLKKNSSNHTMEWPLHLLHLDYPLFICRVIYFQRPYIYKRAHWPLLQRGNPCRSYRVHLFFSLLSFIVYCTIKYVLKVLWIESCTNAKRVNVHTNIIDLPAICNLNQAINL